MASPVLIRLWWRGCVSFGGQGARLWRGLAWSYGLLIVFLPSPPAPSPITWPPPTFSCCRGVVAVERRALARRWSVLVAVLGVCTLIALPIALPVLPASDGGLTSALTRYRPRRSAGPNSSDQVARVVLADAR